MRLNEILYFHRNILLIIYVAKACNICYTLFVNDTKNFMNIMIKSGEHFLYSTLISSQTLASTTGYFPTKKNMCHFSQQQQYLVILEMHKDNIYDHETKWSVSIFCQADFLCGNILPLYLSLGSFEGHKCKIFEIFRNCVARCINGRYFLYVCCFCWKFLKDMHSNIVETFHINLLVIAKVSKILLC